MNKWKKIKKIVKNIHFINKAAWIYNGEKLFYQDQNKLAYGSTLIKCKRGTDRMKRIKVECFNFSKWIKQFEGNEVVLDMDIEGAELEVLEKMIKDKTIFIPKNIFCEFHIHKLDIFSQIVKRRYTKRLIRIEEKLKEINNKNN